MCRLTFPTIARLDLQRRMLPRPLGLGLVDQPGLAFVLVLLGGGVVARVDGLLVGELANHTCVSGKGSIAVLPGFANCIDVNGWM